LLGRERVRERVRIILKKLHGLMHSSQCSLAVGFAAALLLLGTALGEAAEQKTPVSQKVPAPQAPAPMLVAPIPVAEVAARATEVSNLLRRMSTLLEPRPQIELIQRLLPEVSKNIELEFSETKKIFQGQPTLAVLQTWQQLWEKRQREMTRWLSLLTLHVAQLQDASNQLANLRKTWGQTGNAAKASKAPGPILQQIDATIAAIEEVQTPMQTRRSTMLDLQDRVAQEVMRCGTVLAEISEAQKKAVGGLLKRETPPIWSAELWARGRAEGPTRVRGVAASKWADLKQYLHDSSKGMPIHIGLFLVLVVLLCSMRRQVQRWAAVGEGSRLATTVFDRPYAAALIGTLFVATSPVLSTLPAVRELSNVLQLMPMIRLTESVVDQRLVRGLYAFVVLFAFDTVRQALAGVPLVEQALILLEMFAGVTLLAVLLTVESLRRSRSQATELARLNAFRVAATLVLLSLAAGLVAGALGYVRLARLLTSVIFGGGALALALFAYVRVLGGVVAFVLRVWPLRLLQMVQHHCKLLERRIYRVLVLGAVAAWLGRILDYIGLFQPALSLGKAVLAAKLERGAISISVGDVLAFVLTVWVSYLLSRFLRFVLQEDVYPRMGIARGLSFAISSLLHYVILALGFVVGMGLLGVNLTKVTVLAGAFGVGIGFGLQSIVNNFVSGLILLFERPIHVGDIVEIGDLQGEVKRIGIRSSVVRTWIGSDIIVPNSQLVSEKVTNWTLGDELRRIDVPVGVSYGSEPKKMIELMEEVAASHPLVLKQPAPRALFMGYGDSSINFELRAWTDQFAKWYQIRSDLTVALYHAVREAGMVFPFPQREVRLLGDYKTGAEAGGSQSSPPEEHTDSASGSKGGEG
jgi:potassium efflux system protein